MTRYTKIGRKTHLEASDFQVQALIPRRKRQISNDSNSNNNEYTRKRTAGSAIDNHRDKRARQKKNNTICYSCRKTGHSVSECPNAKEQGVGYCYKCGSKDHTTKRCHIKADVYTFAQCFICNEKGHLASKCPQNDRGVYPNGGCCRFCGSICHLSKDCKPASANQGKYIYIYIYDLY
ncbi:hypothetical protein BDF22DRAFT_618541 [Syncephalis plumigaleata]|nr:hypothetical protein BDF22DRAFT_618541 [Syncephalis plumigaleata]